MFKDHPSYHIPISALCHLFLGCPSLLILPKTFAVIAQVLADTGNSQAQIEIMMSLVNFLSSEDQASNDTDDTDAKVDIKDLLGTGASFSDAGIPSAVMQTFLGRILQLTISQNMELAKPALQAVVIALEQGIVHPILCIPTICAMESCEDTGMSRSAFHIHQKMHEKHTSFIHSKVFESVNCIYAYQLARNSPPCGISKCTNVSVFAPMYTLLRQTKFRRNEFLGHLCDLLDVKSKSKLKEGAFNLENYTFIYFLSQAIATIPFSTVNEVLIVVRKLNWMCSFMADNMETDAPEPHDVWQSLHLESFESARQYILSRYDLAG